MLTHCACRPRRVGGAVMPGTAPGCLADGAWGLLQPGHDPARKLRREMFAAGGLSGGALLSLARSSLERTLAQSVPRRPRLLGRGRDEASSWQAFGAFCRSGACLCVVGRLPSVRARPWSALSRRLGSARHLERRGKRPPAGNSGGPGLLFGFGSASSGAAGNGALLRGGLVPGVSSAGAFSPS